MSAERRTVLDRAKGCRLLLPGDPGYEDAYFMKHPYALRSLPADIRVSQLAYYDWPVLREGEQGPPRLLRGSQR